MSVNDPGCVKTPTSNLSVESLSRLYSIRKEPLWQSPSKEEKREDNSAHSLLVHVFTQPGPKSDIGKADDGPRDSTSLTSRPPASVKLNEPELLEFYSGRKARPICFQRLRQSLSRKPYCRFRRRSWQYPRSSQTNFLTGRVSAPP